MQKDIEKIIIKAFKQRRLKTNPQSFNRLKDMMTLQKLKKRSKFYKVLAIAATFIIFVFVLGTEMQKPSLTKNKIINANINDRTIKTKKIIKTSPKIIISKTNSVVVKNKPIVKNLILQNKRFSHVMINNNGMSEIVESNFLRLPSKLFVKSNFKFSDTELDSLLATASSKLKTDGMDSLSVDALQMLYEIEIEINKPLPEKIILSFKSGRKTIKEIINPKNNN